MGLIKVGKIVNTHGLKGELKVLSTFELKNVVFKKNSSVIINKKEYVIDSSRDNIKHILVKLKDLNDINQVEHLKGFDIYIKRDNLKLKENEYILDDLIGLEIILNDEYAGKVMNYQDGINPLLIIDNDKKYYIPIKGDFIKSVDLKNKKIYANDNTKELIIWK